MTQSHAVTGHRYSRHQRCHSVHDPLELSVWIQRASRAGRDARAILLVEPLVVKRLAPKSSKNRGAQKASQKAVFHWGVLHVGNRLGLAAEF